MTPNFEGKVANTRNRSRPSSFDLMRAAAAYAGAQLSTTQEEAPHTPWRNPPQVRLTFLPRDTQLTASASHSSSWGRE